MRSLIALAAVSLLALPGSAKAEPSRFDGPWRVTMTCPPHDDADDDAKGYTHQWSGEVVEGQLSATHGTEGQPGWHFLRGKISPNGDAALRLDGIVNNPKYAINDAPKGKPYTYRVKAHFDGSEGTGQRLTGRVCVFRFAR
jgi:hypothetical protein